jgi:very-short-patch-repair endonuclease
MRGSSLTDEELEALGISRRKSEYGNAIYTVPCAVCGRAVTTRSFSTNKTYKCRLCKNEVARRMAENAKAAKLEHDSIMADELGTDAEHAARFEKAASRFDDSYSKSIVKARTVIDRFDSSPEAVAGIGLLHIGARVIAHQKVGMYTVDFCLPDEKVVVEVDGSIYHTDEMKAHSRDLAVVRMLGMDWVVRHIPADAITKNHTAFERNMRRMLDERREELKG